ncbi:MAG: prolipoprotein diacylglyceryl transferase [Alteromonadaceae bacterium]
MQHFIWDIDPVLLSLGPLSIHWYGALFAAAIMSGLQVMKWVYQKENKNLEALDNLLMYAVFGIIIGARLGHCFFYDPQYYFANPLKILAIWEGGLASHGGGLGLIIALGVYARKYQENYLWLLDRLAIAYLLIFLIVFSIYKKLKDKTPRGSLLGLFLILTFTARFLIESVKVKQAAYESIWALNTGQMLSIPFFIAGIVLLIWSLSTKKKQK